MTDTFEGWYRGIAALEGLSAHDFASANGIEDADLMDPSNLLNVPVDVYIWDHTTSSEPKSTVTLYAMVLDPSHTIVANGVVYLDLGMPWSNTVPRILQDTEAIFLGPTSSAESSTDITTLTYNLTHYLSGAHASTDIVGEPSQFVEGNINDGTLNAILPLAVTPTGATQSLTTLVWSLTLSRANLGSSPSLPSFSECGECVSSSPSVNLETFVPTWLTAAAELFGPTQLGRLNESASSPLWWRHLFERPEAEPVLSHDGAMWSCLNSARAMRSSNRLESLYGFEPNLTNYENALFHLTNVMYMDYEEGLEELGIIDTDHMHRILANHFAVCVEPTPPITGVPFPSCDLCDNRLLLTDYTPPTNIVWGPNIGVHTPTVYLNACSLHPYIHIPSSRPDSVTLPDLLDYHAAARCSIMVATVDAPTLFQTALQRGMTRLASHSTAFVRALDPKTSELAMSNLPHTVPANNPESLTWNNPWYHDVVPWYVPTTIPENELLEEHQYIWQHDQTVPMLASIHGGDSQGQAASLSKVQSLFDICIKDLKRKPPTSPGSHLGLLSPTDINTRLRQLFSSQGCIDLGRFVHEVDWLAAAAKQESQWMLTLETPEQDDVLPIASKRLLWRLHQWMTIHAFVARYGQNNNALERILATEGQPDPNAQSLADILDVLNSGWALMFYPPYLDALAQIPGEWISFPDYRTELIQGLPSTLSEHNKPLPLTILEMASAHLDLTRRYVQTRRAEAYTQCRSGQTTAREETVSLYGRAAKSVLFAESLANSLDRKVSTLELTPEWAEEFTQARSRLGTAWDRVRKEINDTIDCVNPLGIADGSLPLYFVDPQGVNQRFFAVSDYLLTSWAEPAVRAARDALAKARGAWMDQRAADIAQTRTEVDRDKEMQSIRQTYGSRIRDACGLEMTADSAFDAYARGEIDIITCFKPRNEPGCQSVYDKLWKQTLSQLDPRSYPECGEPDRVGLRGLDALKNACMMFREYVGYAYNAPRVKGTHKDISALCPPEDETQWCNTPFNHELPNAFSFWEQRIIKYPDNGPRDETVAYPLRKDKSQWESLYENYRNLRNVLADAIGAEVSTWYKPVSDLGVVYKKPNLETWLRGLTVEQLEPVTGLRVDVCGKEIGFQIGGDCDSDDDCDDLRCFEGRCSVVTDVNLMLSAGAVWAGFGWKTKPGDCSGAGCGKANNSITALLEMRHGDYCAKLLNEQLASFDDTSSEAVAEASIDADANAQCFRGGLGAIEIEILKAKQAIRVAEQRFIDVQSQYEIRGWQCLKGYDLSADVETAQEAFHDALAEVQKQNQVLSLVASGISVMASTALPAFSSTSKVWSNLDSNGNRIPGGHSYSENSAQSGGGAAAVPIIGPILDFLFGTSAKQRRIEERNRRVNAALSKLADHQTCVADLTSIATSADLAIEGVRAAGLDALSAVARLGTEREAIRQHMMEGIESMERAEAWYSRVPDLRHHYWLSEEVTRFETDFEWAKRLVYLTALAVNYETQSEIPFMKEVLGADHPADLEAVLRMLAQEQGVRSINGNRPEEHVSVLSIREQALRLSSRLDSPNGEWRLTAQEDFAARLLDPLNAIYDDHGEYLGQGLHFRIDPTDAQMYRCAERLWSVNASIVGDMLGVSTPELPIFILKRNTFESQWCRGHEPPDGPSRQIGTLKPSVNLFRGKDAKGQAGEDSAYSWAYVQAWLNVPRKEFHRDAYSDGASAELAGRGLYGDYILLFPWWGLLDKGFDLSLLEDVILRFDYLSVSNGSASVGGSPGGGSNPNILPWERRPRNLIGSVTPSAVELSWLNPTFPGFNGVRVIRRAWAEPTTAFPQSPFEGEVIYPEVGHTDTGASLLDTTAEAGKVYYYRVFAIDGAGTAYASFDSFMAEPDWVFPTYCVWQWDDTSVVLSWDAPPSGLGFGSVLIDRQVTTGEGPVRAFLDAESGSPFEDDDVPSGTEYVYKLRVLKGSSVSPDALECVDHDVVGVTAFSADPSVPSVTLTWSNPSGYLDFESVKVLRRLGQAPSGIQDTQADEICDTNTESCIDNTAMAGKTYYYAAYVKSDAGFYHVPQITTVNPDFEEVDDIACTWHQGAARVEWTAPTTGPRFGGARLVRKLASAPTSHTDGTSVEDPASSPSHSTNLQTSSVYHYRVFSALDGAYSATGPSCSLTHSPVQPTGLSATIPFVASGAHVVRLQWSPTAVGAASYRIEASTGSPSSFDPVSSPFDWTVPAGSAGTTPSFLVYARDFLGALKSNASTYITLNPMDVDGLTCARVPSGSSNIVVSFTTPSSGPLFQEAKVVHKTGSYPSYDSDGSSACTRTAIGATSCTFSAGVSPPRYIRVFSRSPTWFWSTTGPSCTL